MLQRSEKEGAHTTSTHADPYGQGLLGCEVLSHSHHRGDVHQPKAHPSDEAVAGDEAGHAVAETRHDEANRGSEGSYDTHRPRAVLRYQSRSDQAGQGVHTNLEETWESFSKYGGHDM